MVTLVLAIAGVMGGTIPVIAIIVAVICFVLFRRTVAGGCLGAIAPAACPPGSVRAAARAADNTARRSKP